MSWTVFIWCIEDASEYKSFFLTDLKQIARGTRESDTRYIIRYMSTKDVFGCYDIEVAHGRVEMTALDHTENTEKCFHDWLSGGRWTGRRALIFSGHSSGWDVGSHELIAYFPTWQIRRVLRELAFPVEIVAFDGCYMSTLENAMEMEGVARYMIACETTSPNLGMAGAPEAFHGDAPEVARKIAELYINRNDQAYMSDKDVYGTDHTLYPTAYPTDVAVTDLSQVIETAANMKKPGALVIPDNPEFPFRNIESDAVILHMWTKQKIDGPDQPDRKRMSGMSVCANIKGYTDRGADYKNLRLSSFRAGSS